MLYKITIKVSTDKLEWYNSDGKEHRENDRPVVICDNGTKYWYVNGKCHRENNQPALIMADGFQEWWINDIWQRDNGD
jgi:hypothetical protein